MKKSLSEPLDEFLHYRIDAETSDKIAAAGGDEGILDVSELDGFLTALVSSPNVIIPSRWLPAMWGAAEPIWESADQFREIFGLIVRHQSSTAEFRGKNRRNWMRIDCAGCGITLASQAKWNRLW